MPARVILPASTATTDGVRRLREILRFTSAPQLAAKTACDATAIRRWAKGDRTPRPESRAVLEAKLGIPVASWEIVLEEDAVHTAYTRPNA